MGLVYIALAIIPINNNIISQGNLAMQAGRQGLNQPPVAYSHIIHHRFLDVKLKVSTLAVLPTLFQ